MTMIPREKIAREARSWINTPFVHQGRVKGVGVDCAGLVEMVPKRFGLYPDAVIAPYLASPNPVEMRKQLLRYLNPIPFSDVLVGDVLWFRVDRDGQHLGIVVQGSPMSMVHAFGRERIMRCIEQSVEGFWRQRLVGCFRYRGVE